MTQPTTNQEELRREYNKKFTRNEAFGGNGGHGVRLMCAFGDNPDYAEEIFLDAIFDWFLSELKKVREEEKARIKPYLDSIKNKCEKLDNLADSLHPKEDSNE